ncbi:hypothetical protein BWQ96_03335 [Gracilariopsis chorda]|uniref:BZIP domain-containing protein n=1 Tax=Gracilariopsis chorda TaxID=448386 RepID=A0A2V3IXC3_9FLOR|nr:hypothetical protein BWQ96_03335 [Gracilariopsis chorda]|eukprot:PXF46806.1 hypothetical protein BWQ96_03335 [Gracilariopsis chorda]
MFSLANSPNLNESQLGDIPTADLLNEINPELVNYLKYNTPEVYAALLAQDRTNSNDLPTPDVTGPLSDVIDSTIPAAPPQVAAASPAPTPFATSSPLALDQAAQPVSSVANHAAAPTANLVPPVPLIPQRHAPAVNAIPSSVQNSLPSSNPALMAVLRQARAISNVNPLNQQGHLPRPYFPPQARLGASQRYPQSSAPNNSAAVAAVAGAAAAAAAAANTIHSHPQYAALAMQRTRFPQRTPVVMRQNVPCTQSRVTAPQFTRMTPSSALRPGVRTVPGPAGCLEPQLAPSRTASRKRLNAEATGDAIIVSKVPPSVYHTQSTSAASSSSNSSIAAAFGSGNIVQYLSPVVSASGNPAAVKHANVVANVGAVPVQLKLGQEEQVAAQLSLSSKQQPDTPEDAEVKKVIRAERNRQSAAASRERKKQHIKELERRVEMLSRENAMMQLSQLRTVRQRIELESKILHQMKALQRKVVDRDMQIHRLSRQLKDAKIKNGEDKNEQSDIPRPSTWDSAEWQKKKSRRSLGRA